MNKSFIKNLKFLALGLLFVGASAFAGSWSAPSSTPTGGNIALPIHGGADQVKDGGLSVGHFISDGDSSFGQQFFINGLVKTGTDLKIGGLNGGVNRVANATVSGDIATDTSIRANNVVNSSLGHLCADTNGKIVLCPVTTVDVCPNIAGDQATVPSGMEIDPTSGNCLLILGGGGHSPGPTQNTGFSTATITLMNSQIPNGPNGSGFSVSGPYYGKVEMSTLSGLIMPGDPNSWVVDTVDNSYSPPGGNIPAVQSLGTVGLRAGTYHLDFTAYCTANIQGGPFLHVSNSSGPESAVNVSSPFVFAPGVTYNFIVRCSA